MKWILDNSWGDIKNLAVYGFGKTAKGSIDKFINEFHVVTIIDNNPVFSNQSYKGIPIKSLEQFQKSEWWRNVKVVLLVAGKARQSVKKTLDDASLVDGMDYIDLDTFSTEWYYRFKGKFNIGKIGESITNRCTFNCRGCNMLMPYYKQPKDYPLEMLKKDADLLFYMVDEVSCFSVIGGEPLLHPELDKYLEHIGENYENRIGNLQLITNGSILPNESVLEKIKQYNVEVRLSDYMHTIPYQKRYEQVKDVLEQNNINWLEFKQTEWINFGFPEESVCMGETPEELRTHMLNCHGMCHWLHDGKMYFCSNAWSAQETGLVSLNEEQDYIDLLTTMQMYRGGRDALYSFYLGNMKDGYMSHCKRCRGFASTCVMNAAVQMKRTLKLVMEKNG
ncbi:MAG: radical SAM protein [Treponema sp.]|nr:radical SAM protein [Treponema sp.]